MRVKRTLPPRTTVVKHEGATEGEWIEHGWGEEGKVRDGGTLERGWRMLASVVAEVVTEEAGSGGGSRARALQRVGGGRAARPTRVAAG